jgi:hypothetical protein
VIMGQCLPGLLQSSTKIRRAFTVHFSRNLYSFTGGGKGLFCSDVRCLMKVSIKANYFDRF